MHKSFNRDNINDFCYALYRNKSAKFKFSSYVHLPCLSVCACVCVCVSVCVSVCVHDNSGNKGSLHLKLEHIVVYENSSDKFDIGHCLIKVKVTA